MRSLVPYVFLLLFVGPTVCAEARAAEPVSLEAQVRELTRAVQDLRLTVENQQREIALLKGQTPPPFRTPAAPAAGPAAARGRWNPDIGVVADTLVTADTPKADTEGADRLSVREVEVIFGSNVDPYSRLDATFAFSDFEEASLDEAYLTHFALPWEVTGRVGRFRPRVGKVLQTHRDALDTVDMPLAVQRYFGSEGYARSGADLTRALDLPFDSAHEVTLGVLEGGNEEGGTLFGDRRRPTFYARSKNYWDLGEVTGLELGASFLSGSRDADVSREVGVFAADLSLFHDFEPPRRLKLQAEAFHVNRRESLTMLADAVTGVVTAQDLDGTLWGAYGLADLRFHVNWAAGLRLDRVEPIDAFGNPDPADTGYTGYLTFYQSEFARWRLQFSHLDLAAGENDDRVFVQGTFSIGEHKHKLQ